MAATFLGVRHHSPACARHVAETIRALRPAHVLVEGPADMNQRLDEVLLDHHLPIAIFTSYRDREHIHASWAPLCDYSPEWLALTTGREVGAQLRFIDLPAWHPAFALRENRYADAEQRYAAGIERLCAEFAVDDIDSLWDHLVEAVDPAGLGERLDTYFELLRGDAQAGPSDLARESYMAQWVRAALADAGERPVVVVTGGFHRPALVRASATAVDGDGSWPDVPVAPEAASSGSYLVPYSFRRLDSFSGYQSGMPSPGYYQRLWDEGGPAAADGLVADVVERLRERKQRVSTADLIAARAMTAGLARVRGHAHPARTDVLDGLASALVTEVLDVPLPWTRRGTLEVGTDPVVVQMVAATSGARVGALHPDTPQPPLVDDVTHELDRHRLDTPGPVTLDLRTERERANVLHRLRVLGVTDFRREAGPDDLGEPVQTETWSIEQTEHRLPQIIEAAAYGRSLRDAATAALVERAAQAGDVHALATVLADASWCGLGELAAEVLALIADRLRVVHDLGALGAMLAVVLGVWRHDRVLGLARDAALATVIIAAVPRLLWLAEGVRGGPAPADAARLAALVALRDTLTLGPGGVDASAALVVMDRLARSPHVPPDLGGAALGFGWSMQRPPADPVRAVRLAARPHIVGDWLAGLFALAREEVVADAAVLATLDDVFGELSDRDFLIALPALRQAFEYFPPREREAIARALLDRRGRGSALEAREFLRGAPADAVLHAEAAALEEHVDAVLAREGLL